jgi:deoxyribodipyrimidine photo-lyase
MSQKYKLGVHIFRRDLRVVDNTALNLALRECEQVLCLFILNPVQIGDSNQYRSLNAMEFLFESLDDLATQLREQKGKLYVFYGGITKILSDLPTFDALYVNRDYTPFSVKRDQVIADWCAEKKIQFSSCDDALLVNADEVAKPDGGRYTIFTPFYKKAMQHFIARPVNLVAGHFYHKDLANTVDVWKYLPMKNPRLAVHGGRANAMAILANIKKYENYDDTRNIPALDATTKLSAHNKFGTISAREVFAKVSATFDVNHSLIRELFWRDFFTYIAHHNPRVFGEAFQIKYKNLDWENDISKFDAWCNGLTGFPIVDAGMRELVQTGFMHNRVRMIVASFLVKDLHIDWQWGEKFFAQHLIDYDPCVNNGSWQWAASTGCDAQPYYRIFNPWLQQEKFDPDCVYIKRWITELEKYSAAEIHSLGERDVSLLAYPRPIVDHATEKEEALKMFKMSDRSTS